MKKLALFVFLLTGSLFAQQQQVLDKVVAVIGDEVILQSELDNEVRVFSAQRNLNPNDPELKKQILNARIEDKLLYAQAEKDSIVVSDEQVNSQIEYQLNYLTQQFGSQERMEQAYGMSIEKIKRELRDDTRKNIMINMIKQKKFGQIDVTRSEVKKFYEVYKDSIGMVPETFKLAHIFVNPKASEKVKETAAIFAKSLIDSIEAGADFEELAKKYSDDPGSAGKGGNLGFVKRGIFFPEFESAAFALEEGETSGVVESPVGFHIIQLLERRGESINTRHILIKPKADDATDVKAIEFLSEIRDSIINGDSTFEYYANKYSDDKETANKGGKLGVFEVGQLEPAMKKKVYDMEVGDISFPKRLELDRNTYGFHIIKLIERTPEHKPTLEEDYDALKQAAEYKKREELYTEWIADLKDDFYWEIRI